MSRIEELIRRVETGEAIDAAREVKLLALEFARQDEVFAGEMIELLRRLGEVHTEAADK